MCVCDTVCAVGSRSFNVKWADLNRFKSSTKFVVRSVRIGMGYLNLARQEEERALTHIDLCRRC